jgi:osmotically-inducible protein OsmY
MHATEVTIHAGQVLLEGRSSLWSGTKFLNSIHEAIYPAPTQVMLLRSEATLVAGRSVNRSSGAITLCSKTEGNMKKTDSEIQQAVLRELKWDTRVEATDIGVEVDGGVVTLTGAVSSWAKRIAAQEAAHRVVGVLYVGNDVHVVPGTKQIPLLRRGRHGGVPRRSKSGNPARPPRAAPVPTGLGPDAPDG